MEGIVTRKYNQQTKEWNSKIVKVDKSYEYIQLVRIAPTISHVPPVASKELFQLQQEKN